MRNIICTVITNNYAHYALALHDSFKDYDDTVDYCVFVSNGALDTAYEDEFEARGIVLLTVADFKDNRLAKQMHEKYATVYHDAYRWGMKPLVMIELLNRSYDHVIYVDSDIYFFADYTFLWKELETRSMLLSPHWRCSDPSISETNFRHNFLDGIYNGGFVGASKKGIKAMSYWAELCLFKCEVNRNDGFYVDQRYLDILPTRFEGVGHITHRGCNVANWNIVDCQRVAQADGTVLINNTFPIVFIHFTNSLFKGAYLWKDDALLIPYIERYRDNLLNYSKVDVIAAFFNKGIHQQSRTESDFEKKSLIVKLKTLLKRTVKKVLKTFKLF
ncbi:hypothetical protein [Gaetbulibacter jejuensis]|uniref:hypothetical protein n=1 Tax=Gaetbulibacter TaxID=311207 RepID=UPI00300AD513